MKLGELMTAVDAMRPNRFGTAVKAGWVNDLEARVQIRILGRAPRYVRSYNYSTDAEKELLVRGAWGRILYTSYLCAMLDLGTADAGVYDRSYACFEKAWRELSGWYLETYARDVRTWVASYGTAVIMDAIANGLFGGTFFVQRLRRDIYAVYDGDCCLGSVDCARRVPVFHPSGVLPPVPVRDQLERVSQPSVNGTALTFSEVHGATAYVILADGQEIGTVHA